MSDAGERYGAAIRKLIDGASLDRAAAAALMDDIMNGALDATQVAAVLTALAVKGESADELAGFAGVMRAHALAVDVPQPVLDTCGTGGSGLETINTSSIAAFVVAAAGVKVAKHGNRASSGKCGSMDVLEALGVNIELEPAQAESLLRDGPVAFMYARRHHPAVGRVTPVRKALGFRTCFNFLGPICNPAGATLQMMGVSDTRRAPLMLESLRQLGSERVVVACGSDGLDEITLTGPTRVWELRDGETSEREVRPEDYGLEPVAFSEIAGGDVATNAKAFLSILDGSEQGARLSHAAVNAGGGLYVAGKAESLRDGYLLAREIIASGAALAAFEAYRDASQAVSP